MTRPALPVIQREAIIMVGLHALMIISSLITPVLFWVWIVPVLLGQPVLRLYLPAEHGDCPQVENMFANTRTTITTAIIRFLAWNMPFHTEHHVWPAVPFCRLLDLHRRMKDCLQVTAEGYVAFNRDYLTRRLRHNDRTKT
ncbi:MAG: fatty acid desaturase [Rhodobacterales bacterium]|jgi:hypothetical protein|nr:fatty acid desaturase [Rhodobacterales bacterium]